MSVHEGYTAWAATYDTDRNLTRDLDQTITQQLLGATQYAAILELGCGTGKNTAFLSQLGAHVHALDLTAAMIAQAQTKVTASNVTWTVADFTQPWPCADGSVDLVVANLVLEHLADLPFIFAEAFRCLMAGGRFFVSELHPFKQYVGAKASFQRADSRIEIPAFVHHISEFLAAAAAAGLTLMRLDEWWHAEDEATPPRLVPFVFGK